MLIDDNWFLRTMLVNNLSRSEKGNGLSNSINSGTEIPFAKIFTDLLTQMESNLGGTIQTAAANLTDLNNYTQSYQSTANTKGESLRFQPRSADKLNQELDGALTSMGDTFIRAGKLYNLDPALLTAIAKHESGNGKSKAANIKNNIAGMMGHNGLKSYASVEDSIMDMARNVSRNYVDKGLSTISEIGAKYAPIGAANDPTGLNNYWVKGVKKYLDQLTV